MQKKIIALAIASALTVPALAYAEPTVYGQANLSIDRISDGMASSGTSNNLVSNQSRIGVRGSEDLGSGMSAVWQMEGDVGMDEGVAGTTLFSRNTYLGLKSNDMGTLLLGRYDTPYKISTRKLDVFADTIAADNRGLAGIGMMGTLGGLYNHDVRVANSINYTSPTMGGLSLAVASVFGAEGAAAADTKGTALSMAGMYSMDAIYATLAYDSVKFGDVGDLAAGTVNDKSTAFKLGVGFSMDLITVNAVLERPKHTAAIGSVETTSTNLYLGGKFGISSSDAVKAAYTKRGDQKTTGAATVTDNATQVAIGYDHDMSKTTTVYVLYTKVTEKATGLPDPSTFSIGMKHSF